MSYHQFKDPVTGVSFGSFEVFYNDGQLRAEDDPDRPRRPDGFYWWSCFPGCLPDGEAHGPFETEQAAISDAQDFNGG